MSFGENYGKLWTARSTSATGDLTLHLPSTSIELRSAPPLSGLESPGTINCALFENFELNLKSDERRLFHIALMNSNSFLKTSRVLYFSFIYKIIYLE